METEQEVIKAEQTAEITAPVKEPAHKSYLLPASILISAILITGTWVYTTGLKSSAVSHPTLGTAPLAANFEKAVMPEEGVILPVQWGDLGTQLIASGVLNGARFASILEERGIFGPETEKLLGGTSNENITITRENANVLLNLLWAFGLGNKNQILETGPMADPQYGGPGNFASTGGWTLAQGDPMSHYSKHEFVKLTSSQQALVEQVSKNIYRPCCGNATYFPDCNHGMAMLGLLEIMASQGATEDEMYRAGLAVNAYWFPDTYLAIARYLNGRGISWAKADPKEMLGANFSSASGYSRILKEIEPVSPQGGGGCGV